MEALNSKKSGHSLDMELVLFMRDIVICENAV